MSTPTYERYGEPAPAIDKDQAISIIHEASLTPSEGASKMMILEDFHLLAPEGAGRLLKTIEEPPDSTTFIILADFVPHDLITISSRCARIDFRTIGPDVVAARLVAEGISPAEAMAAARAAHGDLDRARGPRHRPGAVGAARCVRPRAAPPRRLGVDRRAHRRRNSWR